MSGFARLAVGAWGRRPDPGPICWGLAASLERRGRQVRHFFSRACYCPPQGGLAATGAASGYLDPWLLSSDDCRRRLAEAYAAADFVLAEGCFPRTDLDHCCGSSPNGTLFENVSSQEGLCGDLSMLANRLDLPRLIVLEAAQVADCRIPPRPDAVDGVLLDGVLDREQFVRLQTCIEGVWGVPVVGGLGQDEGLRQQIAVLPPGRPVSKEIVDAIVARLDPYLQVEALVRIAHRPSLPQPTAAEEPFPLTDRPPTVAVAYDDAFCGYFADALERLEHCGARVVDFSPLADEALPDGTSIVLIGCGRPDVYAERLAENHCMLTALRNFARRGGCMYAEGGGTAYLSRTLTLANGRMVPLVDAIPLAASVRPESPPPEPLELTFDRDCWLATAGSTCRAYRGTRFVFEPQQPLAPLCVAAANDLFCADNVIGGRLQLHIAAHPALFRRMWQPTAASRDVYADVG